MIIPVFQKNRVLDILGPPYCGIGATIRIGREILCLPYAGFFVERVKHIIFFIAVKKNGVGGDFFKILSFLLLYIYIYILFFLFFGQNFL